METIFCISYSLILVIFTAFVLITSRAPQARRVWRMSDDEHGYAVVVYRTGYAFVAGISTGEITVTNPRTFSTLNDAIAHAEELYDLHSAVYSAWGKNIGR